MTSKLEPGAANDEAESETNFAYETEDADVLKDYLAESQYTRGRRQPALHHGQGHGPQRAVPQHLPDVCHRQVRVDRAVREALLRPGQAVDEHGEGAGYVGQITANSFMKREFGKKLIEDYLAHEVELTEVIDTSGAYIPAMARQP